MFVIKKKTEVNTGIFSIFSSISISVITLDKIPVLSPCSQIFNKEQINRVINTKVKKKALDNLCVYKYLFIFSLIKRLYLMTNDLYLCI